MFWPPNYDIMYKYINLDKILFFFFSNQNQRREAKKKERNKRAEKIEWTRNFRVAHISMCKRCVDMYVVRCRHKSLNCITFGKTCRERDKRWVTGISQFQLWISSAIQQLFYSFLFSFDCHWLYEYEIEMLAKAKHSAQHGVEYATSDFICCWLNVSLLCYSIQFLYPIFLLLFFFFVTSIWTLWLKHYIRNK